MASSPWVTEWRRLRAWRAGAAAAVIGLGLALAVTALTFELVDTVLVRPLPFAGADRLVWVWATRTDRDRAFFSIPDFLDHREGAPGAGAFVAVASWGVALQGPGDAVRLRGSRVTPEAFEVLGVTAARGRTLLPEDGAPEAEKVVVLSDGLWRGRFGGDEGILGRSIVLDEQPHRVIGVLPAGFLIPNMDSDAIAPLRLEADPRRSDRGANFLRVMARLAPGATIARAQAELAAVTRRLRAAYPDTNAKKTDPRVLALEEELLGQHRRGLRFLLGAVLGLLALACLNLTNLQLVRFAARDVEFATRRALGATTGRLARQVLVEGLLLAGLAGALALGLAAAFQPLVSSWLPATLPRRETLAFGGRGIAFTVLAAAAAGIVISLGPLRQLRGGGAVPTGLWAGARASSGLEGRRLRAFFVALQVACAFVLLLATGLLLKSFRNLQRVEPGIRAEGLLVARFSLPSARYASRSSLESVAERLEARIRELPGVSGVAVANALPLSRLNVRHDFTITGRPAHSAEDIPGAQSRWVTIDYFRTLGIPVREGRAFTSTDRTGRARVALVDETLARRFWDTSPLGTEMRIDDGSREGLQLEIVGVAGNVKHFALADEPLGTLYLPLHAVPAPVLPVLAGGLSLAVRANHRAPADLDERVARAVRGLDPGAAASPVTPFVRELSDALQGERLNLGLLAAFSVLALALAASGVFALVSAAIVDERRAMAIRLALGATPERLVRSVTARHATWIGLGLAAGALGALGLLRSLDTLLFQVSAQDPATWIASASALAAVGLGTGYLSARRAARIDPAAAFRAG